MINKLALITGGTSGIGKAIALALNKTGVSLYLNYCNNKQDANQTQSELPFARLLKANMSSYNGMYTLLNTIDKLDYLILNVGITDRTPFGKVTIEDWDKVFRTNLTIPFMLVQALKDKINDNGKIIFITSISGTIPDSTSISYGVSKASANMLVKYLAKEFASRKITVNAIAPAYTNTKWHIGKSKAQIKRIEQKNLLKRFAEPEEIAKAVLMVIENDYITGQVISVDGGFGLC